jgi:adenylate cyclase
MTTRRLAAIMVADVVGFSRLMEADEAGTLQVLKERRKAVLEPVVKAHGGRIVKVMGDGVLVEFASAVAAVEAALVLQERMAAANAGLPEARRIVLRIGINLGDVIGEGTDIYGDGVNIAARLEALAEPGGICISGKLYDEVRGKIELAFESIGEQRLKNMSAPVTAYRSVPDSAVAKPATGLELPEKPSIAVLPFQNMSGDPEQEYFADGIVEEIITALTRMKWLFVIARNSSFVYKGRPIDVKQVGRELGARYVLEGSVRKAANRIRITGQLIDTTTGAHLWAERFEGALEDIFELQDQVTANVVGAISPKLEQAEIERVKNKPTANLGAYDHYLRGMAGLHKWSREGNAEALQHFYRAIELDPGYAAAHGMAARAYVQRNSGGWVADRPRELAEAVRLARRAVELGPDDAVALCTAAFALADIAGEPHTAQALIESALDLNPSLAWAWIYNGWIKGALGDAEGALECIARAKRLSPNDPQDFSIQNAAAFAHFIAGRYEEALSCAVAALRRKPNFLLASCNEAASAALAGRPEEAQKAVAQALRIDPTLRLSNAAAIQLIYHPEDRDRWLDGLRKAGLPE